MNRRIGTLIVVVSLTVATIAFANTGTVSAVHPAGVIEISGGWRAHLSGVIVPGPETAVGSRAFDFSKRNVEGKVVKIFTWTTDGTAAGIVYGTHGLAFARIVYGRDWEHDLAAQLLERGMARVDRENLPEDCSHYIAIEAEARQRHVGLWENINN